MLEVFFDIDSTLNDHVNRIRRNSRNGEILPSAFTRQEILKDLPLPKAADAVNGFCRIANIQYLTSRNFEGAHQVSVDWLNNHGFPSCPVHVVKSHHEKIDFLRTHPCDLFIDDMTAGHETGEIYVLSGLIQQMPVPFERFTGDWAKIINKYLSKLPNGEYFLEFMVRNLNWWKANEQEERTSRVPYYKNFLKKTAFVPLTYPAIVGELGAGPLGGIIKALPELFPSEHCVFIDILAEKQKQLGLADWSSDVVCEAPFEDIPLLDDYLDVAISYNALDHGWDIKKAITEAVRISKKCYLAFDCKSGNNPPHDKLDHYQVVDFEEVSAFAHQLPVKSVQCFDLRAVSPEIHFAHNWGFPVMCLIIEK